MPDADREEDPEPDQGGDRRAGGGEEIADRLIAASVAHVLHELDHEAGIERVAGEAHQPGEQPEDEAAGVLQQGRGEADDDEDDDRADQQRAYVWQWIAKASLITSPTAIRFAGGLAASTQPILRAPLATGQARHPRPRGGRTRSP